MVGFEWISGCENGRGLPLSESLETMNVSCEGVGVSGGWNEEITDGREDGDKPLTSPGGAEFLHDPLAFSQR